MRNPLSQRIKVYVDAKITDRHLPDAKHQTFVAFVAEDRPDLSGFGTAKGEDSDRAEEAAMLFAIQKLTASPMNARRFTIVCDHESAVLKANWTGDQRRSRGDETLEELWKEIDANPGVKIEPLLANPAHRFLNLKLKEQESSAI